jgi:hypothetical protein
LVLNLCVLVLLPSLAFLSNSMLTSQSQVNHCQETRNRPPCTKRTQIARPTQRSAQKSASWRASGNLNDSALTRTIHIASARLRGFSSLILRTEKFPRLAGVTARIMRARLRARETSGRRSRWFAVALAFMLSVVSAVRLGRGGEVFWGGWGGWNRARYPPSLSSFSGRSLGGLLMGLWRWGGGLFILSAGAGGVWEGVGRAWTGAGDDGFKRVLQVLA